SCLLSILSAHRITAELVDSKVPKAAYFAADPSGGAMDRCAATGRSRIRTFLFRRRTRWVWHARLIRNSADRRPPPRGGGQPYATERNANRTQQDIADCADQKAHVDRKSDTGAHRDARRQHAGRAVNRPEPRSGP